MSVGNSAWTMICSKAFRCGWKVCAVDEAHAAFGLSVASVRALQSVLAKHAHVSRADVYGSRATGRFRPGSDIDISLRGNALTVADLMLIDREMDDLELPYKLDLSIYHLIEDAALRDHIDRVGCALCEAQRAPQP